VFVELTGSAILTTLSTMPTFHTSPSSIRMLFGLDTTIIVIFTIEYFARSLAHSDSFTQYRIWVTSFFPILDLIAILPYYIEVSREEDTSILFRFSILRTFRLLRVFRAFKYQNQMLLTIEVMYVAVQRSKDALVAISFFILLVLVLFSTLIYFAERGTWDINLGAFVDADGDPSLFDSIPQTAWFALVTMSTVGYGDVVPRSFLGKVLTVPLLMFGLLLIALPSFVLGRNFAITFDEMASTVAAVRRAVRHYSLGVTWNTCSRQTQDPYQGARLTYTVYRRPKRPTPDRPSPTNSAHLLTHRKYRRVVRTPASPIRIALRPTYSYTRIRRCLRARNRKCQSQRSEHACSARTIPLAHAAKDVGWGCAGIFE
jgi:voltage-gated potassium channel Kch